MKIAFLCSYPSWGGLEMNVFRLALWLQARGNQVLLLAQQGTTIFVEAQKANLPVKHLLVRSHYTNIRAARKLANYLQAEDIQFLIFSTAKDTYVAGWAKLFFYPSLHIIYLQQMILGIPKKGIIQTFLYKKLSAWISPLSVLAQQVKQQTYMPVEKIRIIPLGIDTSVFENNPYSKQQARESLGLPTDVFLAGCIGRLDPSKGQDVLIKAIGLLKDENLIIHAVFVGNETYGDIRNYPGQLQALVLTLGLENQVHFRKFTSEPQLAFATLDVFVMSSHAEAYGMVTIEAMASGLPVIGSDNGGTTELLDNGRLGLLFKTNDPPALANALKKIFTDNALRKKLGSMAKTEAIQRYAYQTQCQQIEHLLLTLTN